MSGVRGGLEGNSVVASGEGAGRVKGAVGSLEGGGVADGSLLEIEKVLERQKLEGSSVREITIGGGAAGGMTASISIGS